MRPRQVLSTELLARAAQQGGAVSLADVRADGISKTALHRLRGSELHGLGAGWFTIGPPTWDGYLAAAVGIAGGDAVAWGTTAGALHGIGPQVLPLTFFGESRVPRAREWVRFARSPGERRTVQRGTSPPRVGLDDTVLDIAAGACVDSEPIALVTRVLQERRTTPQRLLRRLEARARIRGRGLLMDVLQDAAGIESVLEHVYVRDVERAHALPPMQRQYVVPETGHRSDGAYPHLRRLIELDGAAYHDPTADQALDNRHLAVGYGTLRFGWLDTYVRACATAGIVAAAVGLPRVPRFCPNCPAAR